MSTAALHGVVFCFIYVYLLFVHHWSSVTPYLWHSVAKFLSSIYWFTSSHKFGTNNKTRQANRMHSVRCKAVVVKRASFINTAHGYVIAAIFILMCLSVCFLFNQFIFLMFSHEAKIAHKHSVCIYISMHTENISSHLTSAVKNIGAPKICIAHSAKKINFGFWQTHKHARAVQSFTC